MTENITLTAAQIRYLMTMAELEKIRPGIRCTDIAAALGVSKPSVHNMMNTLAAAEYIRKDAYGCVYFTDTGRDIARRYRRYYEGISELLAAHFPGAADLRAAVPALLSSIPESELFRRYGRDAANADDVTE